MINLDGKICIVTGATSGIGFYTALEIARMGATVILIGRDEAKCLSAMNIINQQCEAATVSYMMADLSSQVQIRNLAQQIKAQYDHLDILVNNAGGFFLTRKLSVDGIEMTFALNHLAYFLLTNLLLDVIKASCGARVVNVSSGSHHHIQLDFSDLELKGFYNPVRAYGCSKLANILFTYELARRLKDTRVTSNALTPGMVATEIWKKSVPVLAPLIVPTMHHFGKTPQEGAKTSIYVATSPDLEGVTGKYFVDCKAADSSPQSYDEDAARKLWLMSQDLVGV